ncbi:MAG: hypothetical protein ACM3ZA_01035 [Bacillota bacterium]
MANVIVKWRAPQFLRLTQEHVQRGMGKAVLFCEGEAKQAVSRGNITGNSPSAPGEPPKTVTGTLRANIGSEVVVDQGDVVGLVGVKRGAADPYGRRLELGFVGTDKLGRRINQGARPFLRPTVFQNAIEIVRLISRG